MSSGQRFIDEELLLRLLKPWVIGTLYHSEYLRMISAAGIKSWDWVIFGERREQDYKRGFLIRGNKRNSYELNWETSAVLNTIYNYCWYALSSKI